MGLFHRIKCINRIEIFLFGAFASYLLNVFLSGFIMFCIWSATGIYLAIVFVRARAFDKRLPLERYPPESA